MSKDFYRAMANAPPAQAGSSIPAPARKQTTPPAKCPHCKLAFKDENTMREHMNAMYEEGRGHVFCRYCLMNFVDNSQLIKHLSIHHPKVQSLKCPGCNKSFERATEMVRHIERKECPVIDVKKLEEVREEKLWFARELQARHFGDYVDTGDISRNASLRPKAEATVRPNPLQFEVYERLHYTAPVADAQPSRRIEADKSPQGWGQSSLAPSPMPASEGSANQGSLDIPVGPVRKWAGKVLDDANTPTFVYASRVKELRDEGLKPLPSPADPQQTDVTDPQNASPAKSQGLVWLDQGEKPKEPEPAVKPTLLDDFEPAKHDNLPQSLLDYVHAGYRAPPGKDDLWGLYFNPWKDVKKTSEESASSVDINRGPKVHIATPALKPTPDAPTVPAPQTVNLTVPLQNEQQSANTYLEEAKKKEKADDEFAALHDPNGPRFDIRKYLNTTLMKYKCPMPKCFQSYKKPGQLRVHMEGHFQEKQCRYPCPGCKKTFDMLSNLIAHTESLSTRCQFRHSKNYGVFISQALGGIVDVIGGDYERSTVWFAVPDHAKQTFGVEPTIGGDRTGRPTDLKEATAAMETKAIADTENRERDERERADRLYWEDQERKEQENLKLKQDEEEKRRKERERALYPDEMQVEEGMTPAEIQNRKHWREKGLKLKEMLDKKAEEEAEERAREAERLADEEAWMREHEDGYTWDNPY